MDDNWSTALNRDLKGQTATNQSAVRPRREAAGSIRAIRVFRSYSGLLCLYVGLGLTTVCLAGALLSQAQPPAWWGARGILTTNPANDYAPVNQGQLKHIAWQAHDELADHLPGGAGAQLAAAVAAFSASNNYLPANNGQLKTLAKPFYDRLIAAGLTNQYPWSLVTSDDNDYAPANIGQVKHLFSFDVATDTDGDGLPDWWELKYGLDSRDPLDAEADADGDGLSHTDEFSHNTDPHQIDTDRDGLTDGQEIDEYLTNPLKRDTDDDGLTDTEEITLGTCPNLATDGAQSLQDARNRILAHWAMLVTEPLALPHPAGSAADLAALDQALAILSAAEQDEQPIPPPTGSKGPAAEPQLYHFPRRFVPVRYVPGAPTTYKIIMGADGLTGLIKGGDRVEVLPQHTRATAHEGVSWGYHSAVEAWSNAAHIGTSRILETVEQQYFDNAGWITGTRQAHGTWGAYVWFLQNTIGFYSSTSAVFVAAGAATSAIAGVMVGSLGDYCPATFALDHGPVPKCTFPGSQQAEDVRLKPDLTPYYKLVPRLFVTVSPGDVDNDGIPDCADGYDRDPDDPRDDESRGMVFTRWPLHLSLCATNPEQALVRIAYHASDPQAVTEQDGEYALPDGVMRLWAVPAGKYGRSGQSVDSRPAGHYIPPGTYTASALGFSATQRRIMLFVEGVTPVASQDLVVELDPDGEYGPKPFACADRVRMEILKVELDGLRVYDPKLEDAGNAEIKYKIDGPASGFTPRVELTVMDSATEVACIVRKTDASPVIGTEIVKNWDGKWGIKKDGTDTAYKGKFADPKQYKMEVKVYESAASAAAICTKGYDLCVVRLGALEMGFLDDQEVTYHKKTTDDTDNFPFTDNARFAKDVVWKMEHIDFLKPAGPVSRTETRGEQTPTGESYADTDNAAGRTGTEQYFDEDGDGGYTAGLRQANFPPQTPTANKDESSGIESTRYNRPAVYVRTSPVKIWMRFGAHAKSDLTLADCAVGYPVVAYPIWVVGKFGDCPMSGDAADPETGAGDAIRNINPASGPYKLKSTAILANTVGVGPETIEFTFKYNKTGESFVDGNGNGSYDAGETLVNDDGNGTFDADWQVIPGKQTTTHLIYRLADTPKAQAKTAAGHLWLKIVDFTCSWANGQGTSAQVFDKIWNTDNFWTPLVAGPKPNNGNGFRGTGDPTESTRLDMWNNAPKCYSYQHNMGLGNGFNADWLLDFNQGRCEAYQFFLRVFMGTHGIDADRQVMPAMKWRFVSNTGAVSFEKHADAIAHINNGQRPGGVAAQAGDVWYRPRGIWVNANGQANPFYANSDDLVSFWSTDPANGSTDHVFIKYNGRYYDGSYEHAGGANYATINAKADAGVSDYYYGPDQNNPDGKWTFDAGAGVFHDTTATMPLDRIWMGPYGWLWGYERLLKVANDPAVDEMEEP